MFIFDIVDTDRSALIAVPKTTIEEIGNEISCKVASTLHYGSNENLRTLPTFQKQEIMRIVTESIKTVVENDIKGWDGFKRAKIIFKD